LNPSAAGIVRTLFPQGIFNSNQAYTEQAFSILKGTSVSVNRVVVQKRELFPENQLIFFSLALRNSHLTDGEQLTVESDCLYAPARRRRPGA